MISPVFSNRQPVRPRAYVYLIGVPICVLVWSLVLFIVRPRLDESTVYRGIDSILYLAALGALVLVAIPLRYRRSSSLRKLLTVSVVCGLALAFETFVGYMTMGFG